MGYVRALQLLVVFVVLMAAAATARAAAPAMCDEPGEDGLVSLPAALLRSDPGGDGEVAGPPAAARVLVADGDREPPREQCRAGFGRDAGCHPYKPLPAPSRTAGPLAFESFVLVRPPVVPPPDDRAVGFAARADRRLAPGFARRIDRPPRPF